MPTSLTLSSFLVAWAVAIVWQLVRVTVFYGLGRLAASESSPRWQARTRRVLAGRAGVVVERVRRLGAKSVALVYFFPGLAEATQVACGLAGLRARSVYAWVMLGILPWAAMEAVVGLTALIALITGSWPWLVALLVVVVAAACWGQRSTPEEDPEAVTA